MEQKVSIVLTRLTNQNKIITAVKRTVFIITGRFLTMATLTNNGRVVSKINYHTFIKYAQATFPQTIISKRFTVFHDTPVGLIDLFKSAIYHQCTNDFTTNAANVIRNDWFIFNIVEFATFQFFNKISTGACI